MSKNFEEKMRLIREKYGSLTVEERRQVLSKIKRRNIFAFRKLERIKHELLRLESRWAQLEEDPVQLAELEEKILARKEAFFKLLRDADKKE